MIRKLEFGVYVFSNHFFLFFFCFFFCVLNFFFSFCLNLFVAWPIMKSVFIKIFVLGNKYTIFFNTCCNIIPSSQAKIGNIIKSRPIFFFEIFIENSSTIYMHIAHLRWLEKDWFLSIVRKIFHRPFLYILNIF